MDTRMRGWPVLLASLTVLPAAACNRQAETPTVASAPPSAVQEAPERRDARLTTNVQAKLYAEEAVRGRDIAVIADQSVVTLRGTVESDAAKQRALSLAREVEGVTQVKDELRVETARAQPPQAVARGTAGEPRAEGSTPTAVANEAVQPGWTTTRIQAQYFVNPEIKPWNIDVTTSSNGVVTLWMPDSIWSILPSSVAVPVVTTMPRACP